MREAIGPDVDLMCDINQLWSVQPGHRGRPAHRAVPPVLARGSDRARRLSRPGPDRRRARHADRRRRVPLRHRAVPPPAGGALDRHRDDRPAARGRHHAVDEGRRHGRGVQPAGGQPPDPGDPRAPDRRHPERPDRRVHAVDAAAVRGDARRSRTASWSCRRSPASGWTSIRPRSSASRSANHGGIRVGIEAYPRDLPAPRRPSRHPRLGDHHPLRRLAPAAGGASRPCARHRRRS